MNIFIYKDLTALAKAEVLTEFREVQISKSSSGGWALETKDGIMFTLPADTIMMIDPKTDEE